jgi:aspartyl-tRNA(Asn)/glutamyl-tRNA(Gln) amidotransferase subunit A
MAGYDPLEPSTVPVPVPDFTADLEKGVKGLKMGIPSNYYFDLLDPEVEETVRRAIAALEELGAEPVDVSIPSLKYHGAMRFAFMADSMVAHEPYLKSNREDYGPTVLYRTLGGQFVLGAHYAKALKVQRLLKEEHARALQQVDFIVTPTMPNPAHRIDQEKLRIRDVEQPVRGPGSGIVSRCTQPSNATGFPAVSVPCGFSGTGLPIGLQLIGRPFDETTLFRVGHAYESISPARGRRPALVDQS